MNVRLQHERSFLAGFWSPEIITSGAHLCMNHYQVRLQMITCTQDHREINVAAQRCLYMLDQEFSDTIFLHNQHYEPARFMQSLGMNVTTLPGDPVDQIIGIMLFCKLNAVMCQKVMITQLEISSTRGEDVWYIHSQNESLGPFDELGWWTEETLHHHDIDSEHGNVSTIKPDPWYELELSWPSDTDQDSTVVYANFKKNDKN
jgi:hypothetical protein